MPSSNGSKVKRTMSMLSMREPSEWQTGNPDTPRRTRTRSLRRLSISSFRSWTKNTDNFHQESGPRASTPTLSLLHREDGIPPTNQIAVELDSRPVSLVVELDANSELVELPAEVPDEEIPLSWLRKILDRRKKSKALTAEDDEVPTTDIQESKSEAVSSTSSTVCASQTTVQPTLEPRKGLARYRRRLAASMPDLRLVAPKEVTQSATCHEPVKSARTSFDSPTAGAASLPARYKRRYASTSDLRSVTPDSLSPSTPLAQSIRTCTSFESASPVSDTGITAGHSTRYKRRYVRSMPDLHSNARIERTECPLIQGQTWNQVILHRSSAPGDTASLLSAPAILCSPSHHVPPFTHSAGICHACGHLLGDPLLPIEEHESEDGESPLHLPIAGTSTQKTPKAEMADRLARLHDRESTTETFLRSPTPRRRRAYRRRPSSTTSSVSVAGSAPADRSTGSSVTSFETSSTNITVPSYHSKSTHSSLRSCPGRKTPGVVARNCVCVDAVPCAPSCPRCRTFRTMHSYQGSRNGVRRLPMSMPIMFGPGPSRGQVVPMFVASDDGDGAWKPLLVQREEWIERKRLGVRPGMNYGVRGPGDVGYGGRGEAGSVRR